MKFLFNITPISSCLFPNWAYPYGAPNIPEPSRQLSYQYSIHHNLLPRSACPNTACPNQETLVAKDVMNDLLTFSPEHLHSKMVGILCAYERDLYLLLLLEFVRSQHCIFVLVNLGNDAEYPPSKHYSDTLSPKLYDNLNYLLNVNYSGSATCNKAKTFIETEVAAMKLQGFNL